MKLIKKFRAAAGLEKLKRRIGLYEWLLRKTDDPRLARHYRFSIRKAEDSLYRLLAFTLI